MWRLVLTRIGLDDLKGRLRAWHQGCQQRRHAALLFLRPLSALHLSICHTERMSSVGRSVRCWQLRARLTTKIMWQVSSKRLSRNRKGGCSILLIASQKMGLGVTARLREWRNRARALPSARLLLREIGRVLRDPRGTAITSWRQRAGRAARRVKA